MKQPNVILLNISCDLKKAHFMLSKTYKMHLGSVPERWELQCSQYTAATRDVKLLTRPGCQHCQRQLSPEIMQNEGIQGQQCSQSLRKTK